MDPATPSLPEAASLAAVLDHVEDAVFAVGAGGSLIYANRAAAQLFGVDERASFPLRGMEFPTQRFEVLDADGKPVPTEMLPTRRALATRERVEARYVFRNRSTGREVAYRARSFPVSDASGALTVVTVLSDASDHQRSLDDLRVSHAWFSTTLRSIGDAVIATDHEGSVNFMNEVAEELTGWSSADAHGLPLKRVFHIINEKTRLEVESPVTKVLREGVVVGLADHTVLVRRDGAELAIDDSGAPIRDATGKLVGVVLVFRDVTAKRREEERLLFLGEASAILASSIDYATTLRTVAGLAVPRVADWCLVQVRDETGAFRLLAYSHSNPAKARWLFEIERLFPPDPAAASGLAAVVRTGQSELVEDVGDAGLRSLAASQEHFELLRRVGVRSRMIVPMRARDRTFGAITLGATEASRPLGPEDLALAEQLARAAAIAIDNARLYAEAQEASRAKDEFLAMLSHELRTPLNAILGWARMLRVGPSEVERRERGLMIIERNARAQARLIDDLLDVIADRDRASSRSTCAASTCPTSSSSSSTRCGRPPTRRACGSTSASNRLLAPYAGDPQRLQQVAWNLLANAVKFTPRDGEVSIDLRRVGSHVQLQVRDNGHGIEGDLLPAVFDRFRQADASTTRIHMGMGLGLSIVKAIVELHGGSVRAESPGLGQGSTFTVTLPIAAKVDESAYPLAPPTPSVDLHGLRVLVVDDEEDHRELLAVMLEQAGATVNAVTSVAEAMAAVAADPAIDLILSDVGMPGEDGYSFVRKLRARPDRRTAQLPAVALTAHAQRSDRAESLLAGFQEHLSKPIDPAELLVAVARLTGRLKSEP